MQSRRSILFLPLTLAVLLVLGQTKTRAQISVPVVDVEVAIGVDNPTPSPGDTIQYWISATNNGLLGASGVQITDQLPPGVTYVTHVSTRGTYDPITGVWDLGFLGSFELVGLAITATVDKGASGIITNAVEVTAVNEGDSNPANNSASIDIFVSPSLFRVASGKFTGNGTSQSIAGLGFAPSFVLVKGTNGAVTIARSLTMPGSKELGLNNPLLFNGVTALGGDGFSVGAHPAVNELDSTFCWTAFSIANGIMGVGTYLGDGNDNRSISGLGFQPDYVIVMGENNEVSMQRFADQPVDASLPFQKDDEKSDRIQDFEPDGFQVGKHNTVNENGQQFHYVAWATTDSTVNTGTYNGDSSGNRMISAVGFEPEFVIVTKQTNSGEADAVQRLGSTIGDNTLPVPPGTPFSGGIKAFSPSGFVVGADQRVNESAQRYYWTALSSTPILDLGAALYVDNAVPNEGDTITYRFSIVNAGPSDATGVTATDTLPAGVTYVSDSPSQGNYTKATGKWTVGSIVAGDSAVLTITTIVDTGTAGTTIRHTAAITGVDQTESEPSNDKAAVDVTVPVADVAVSLSVDESMAAEGDTIRYTVAVSNRGPDGADNIVVNDVLPPEVTYVADFPDVGAYDTLTGDWTVGSLAAAGGAQLTLDASVNPGTSGLNIFNKAFAKASQADPDSTNNADSVAVQVFVSVTLDDTPSSLYPTSTYAGTPDLSLRIGVDNPASVGVTLDTTSTVAFTDGTEHYTAHLANPTFVPAGANNFTLGYVAAPVPAAITADTSYQLTLDLEGTTSEGMSYDESIASDATNMVTVAVAKMAVTAPALGAVSSNPGEADVPLLVLTFDNAYVADRTLDSLTITNVSFGLGAPSDWDAVVSRLRLYDDVDESSSLTPADTAVASSVFSAGRATFAVGGAWSVPGGASATVVVSCDVDSFAAIDGNAVDVAITSEQDIAFVEPTTFAAEISPLFPRNSAGVATIDGMMSFQASIATVAPDTLVSGATGVALAMVTVPSNGPVADTLESFDVADFEGDFDAADFSSVRLYADDGDLAFDPSDALLGTMVYSGDRFQLTGLAQPVAPGGAVFFVVADVANDAVDGHHFRAGLPTGGLQMASGNDGPLDAPLSAGTSSFIRRQEVIEVTGQSIASMTPSPGDKDVPLLRLRLLNNSTSTVTLDTLIVENDTRGTGSATELDGEIEQLKIFHEDTAPNGTVDPWDILVGSGMTFSAGSVASPALGLAIDPGESIDLLVACDVDSFCAADFDTIGVSLPSAASLRFDVPTPITGAFPFATPGSPIIDGMKAHQIHIYPATDSLILTTANDNLILDFALPGNGYRADQLDELTIVNQGTATSEHISRIALYRDGGDGTFDAGGGDDVWLGDFSELLPGEYKLSGLALALPASCGNSLRFFVSADLTSDPSSGGSIQIEIPVGGVAVESSNDGPIDQPARSPVVQLVPRPDELTVFPYSVGDQSVTPGAMDVLNFGIGFYNGFDNTVVLDSLVLFQLGGAVSAELLRVAAYADVDTNGLFSVADDMEIGEGQLAGIDRYRFSNLALMLAPKRITYVFVAYDLSMVVRDSVSINLELDREADLGFAGGSPIVVRGEFPINSPGLDYTNGMIRDQIQLVVAPERRVAPGSQNVFGIGLVVPSNGTLSDVLERVLVQNGGTAVAGQDIAFLNLWIDDDDDGAFDPGLDRLATSLAWSGTEWTNLFSISEPIPTSGLRCFVTADLTAGAMDNQTIQLLIPQDGVQVESGNDGPIDVAVVNPKVQTISTDPLLTALQTDRDTYSVGQTVTLTMTASNEGNSPLTGVHPSMVTVSGAGTVAFSAGPNPASATIPPDSSVDFSWTYTATSPGDVVFCAYASNGDSTEMSASTCAPQAALQSRPIGVTLTIDDTSPPGANRGQVNVPLTTITLAYDDYDTLAAPVRVEGIEIGFVDGTLSPVAPNSRLARIRSVSSNGSNYPVDTADSTSSPMRLEFDPPVDVDPGGSVDIDVNIDVSSGAAFGPMHGNVSASSALLVRDANDGAAVPLNTAASFPWYTNLIQISDPAESLLVASIDTSTANVNLGQEDVLLFRLSLQHSGSPSTADELLTRFSLSFYDTSGASIIPSDVIRELSVYADGNLLYAADILPTPDNTVLCDLDTELLLRAGVEKTVIVRADMRSFPQWAGFEAAVLGPAAIEVRDNNSGLPIAVAAMEPAAPFPLGSRRLTFQEPATGLTTISRSDVPPMLLPSNPSVDLLTISFAHSDTTASSSVRIDSLALEFNNATGGVLFPGDYFNRLYLVSGSDTLAQVSSLSGVNPLVECSFSTPLLLAPGEMDSLTVAVGTKSVYSPSAFRVRVEQPHIYAVDVNDGTRILGVSGPFPLTTETSWLRIPGATIACDLLSRLPANITGAEQQLVAFDLRLENRSTTGYTPAELRTLSVQTENWRSSAVDPSRVGTSASLLVGDSVVASGTISSSDIRFDVTPGAITVDAAQSLDVTFAIDLTGTLSDESFRFVIPDTASVVFFDVATGEPISNGANVGQYPMRTNFAHVLGSGMAAGFTNYPNPFAAGREPTTLTFFLEERSRVTLELYTLWGAPVKTLLDGEWRDGGLHQDVQWSGKNGDGDVVNNGVYHLVLEINPESGGSHSFRRKVGVIR